VKIYVSRKRVKQGGDEAFAIVILNLLVQRGIYE